MTHPECYPDDVLQAYHDGAAVAAIALSVAAHLDECATCLERLQSLDTATDTLVGALRRQRAAPPPPFDPLLEQAMANVLAGKTATPWAAELAPGSVLDEYRLIERLGSGGMGAVYRALHIRLDKEIALKVIQPRWRRNASMIERFEREMKAIGKLKHPHIVQATDAGEAGGVLYLAMELEQGTDLHEYVKNHGPLPVTAACEYIRQAALGLQCAHDAGVVHRDVKPSNLLRTEEGRIKLLDLGLARLDEDSALSSDKPALTADEAETGFELACTLGPMGTDDYMAPEQWQDAHQVDQRTDLYGLGCTLFYLLTGKPPFAAPTYPTRIQKRAAHLAAPPPALRSLRPDVPPQVDALVQCLLAKRAENRPASAAAVAELLAAAATAKQRRRWFAGAALVLAAAALAAAVVLPPQRPDPDPTPQTGGPEDPKQLAAVDPTAGEIPMSQDKARALQQSWAKKLAREVVQTNSIGMKFAVVPPGKFTAWGVTTIVLSRPFDISVTEVTRAQFRAFVLAANYRTEAETSGKGGFVYLPSLGRPQVRRGSDFVWWTPGYSDPADDHPVVHVTWQDAVAFCEWLSTRENRNYFLPSVAEWQWACRAGAATRFHHSDDPKELDKDAWYAANSHGRIQSVGAKRPNAWGLHDMFGNVQEFCRDGPGSWPPGEVVDPLMPLATKTRFVIGGHHQAKLAAQDDQTLLNCRIGAGQEPNEANTVTGFRVVRKQ